MTSARAELLALAWAKTKAAWDPETHSGIDPGEAVEQAAVELLESHASGSALESIAVTDLPMTTTSADAISQLWRRLQGVREAVSETDLPPMTSSADAIRQLWDRLLDAEAASIAAESELRAAVELTREHSEHVRRLGQPEPAAVAVFSAPIGEAVTGEQWITDAIRHARISTGPTYFEARDSHVLVRSDSTVEGVAASWREQFGGDSVHEGLRATDEPKTPNAPGWWWRMHGDNLEHATPVLVSATPGYDGATLGFRWRNDEGYTTSVDGSHWGGRIMRPGAP